MTNPKNTIVQWRIEFEAESWQQKRNRLVKFGADKLLFEDIWSKANSSEERWKNLAAIAESVTALQQEIADGLRHG